MELRLSKPHLQFSHRSHSSERDSRRTLFVKGALQGVHGVSSRSPTLSKPGDIKHLLALSLLSLSRGAKQRCFAPQ
jgi:hypothetical protein